MVQQLIFKHSKNLNFNIEIKNLIVDGRETERRNKTNKCRKNWQKFFENPPSTSSI